MGNSLERVNDNSDHDDVYDVQKIYWDADGNLRHGTTQRNRDDEILKLLQADTNDDTDQTKVWIIVPSRWIRMWLLFAHFKLIGDPPGPIDMLSLLKKDPTIPGGWRAKKNLLPPSTKFGEERPGHYRRISLEAWLRLVDLYGLDGYALAVRGTPFEDTSRWRVFKDPRKIDISMLPEPIIKEDGKIDDPKLGAGDLMKSLGLSGLLGLGSSGNDSGKEKSK